MCTIRISLLSLLKDAVCPGDRTLLDSFANCCNRNYSFNKQNNTFNKVNNSFSKWNNSLKNNNSRRKRNDSMMWKSNQLNSVKKFPPCCRSVHNKGGIFSLFEILDTKNRPPPNRLKLRFWAFQNIIRLDFLNAVIPVPGRYPISDAEIPVPGRYPISRYPISVPHAPVLARSGDAVSTYDLDHPKGK